jgi:2-oxoglutarate ferredoxin oxidoreductase subunit delta
MDMDSLTPKGYHPARLVEEGCTGCGICGLVCPEAALTIYREAPVRPARAASTTQEN